MPSSEVPDPRWRAALGWAAGTLVLALALIGARVVRFDAYWLFREHPPWVAVTGGSNRLIDRQTRRAKSLQAMTRDYRVALIGSSTTYHGLDPRDVDTARLGPAFNLGISALMGSELPVVASIVAARGGVDRATVGLDYYMFSRINAPAGLDRGLATATGRANARLGSVWGLYAVEDASLDAVQNSSDPGGWTREGFRDTPPLSPALTRQNDAIRGRTAAPYRPDTLSGLAQALERLRPVEVTVFLSPVNEAQRRVLAEAGLLDDFARWRADTARVATEGGARFLDLADLGTDEPFDPAKGSTSVWIDNLHYTPVLGRRVLERLGLRPADRQPEPLRSEPRG